MTPERWQQVQTLFQQAADLDAQRRAALLDEACAGDPELRREVESLLASDAETHDLVDEPLVDLHEPPAPKGRRIGPYKVLDEIGRGGLGVVYLAARADDEFEQRVALKVIKRGMDTDEVVRRFRRERQILANLEHPSIARLLDGGSTEDGLPYFVMELVDGERLDRYCESHALGAEARLRLFLRVCSAVETAHRNLVVHRDLKPSNILVSDGEPKLLDFGIAKLLTPDEDAPTVLTVPGSSPMTPEYASPEQARGEAVTTATDVYSLGVILHHLLTGRLPGSSSPLPLGEGLGVRVLKGDLGCIVRKALREEPEHRYGSVEQLADDVRRHLDGRPVLAREGAWLYKTGKFLRRNRWPLLVASVIVLLVVVAVAMKVESARQVAEAELAQRLSAERAEEANRQSEIRSELLKNLFTPSDFRGGESFTIRDLLDRAQERVRDNLEGEPLATQQEILGLLYNSLGAGDEARKLLEASLKLRRELYEGDHPLLARGLNNLAALHYYAGEYDEAGTLYQESLDMRRRLGQEGVDVVVSMSNLAAILATRGDYDGAEELYRRVLAIREKAYGADDASVATSLRTLGTLLYLRGHFEDAEPLLRRALKIRRHHFGEHDRRVASAESSLARILHAQGKLAEAKRLFETVLATRRELLGETHPHVALTRADLAALLLDLDEVEKAEAHLAEALRILRAWKGEDAWEVAEAESVWGAVLTKLGRYEEAEPFLTGGYRTLQDERGAEAVYTKNAHRRLVELYAAWGRTPPAWVSPNPR